MDDKIIIGAIRACDGKEKLENTFTLFKVGDKQRRIDILLGAMYNPQIFFSAGQLSVDDKYILTVESFLSMTWKISEIYEKMGA
jgi:hypothetical protein